MNYFTLTSQSSLHLALVNRGLGNEGKSLLILIPLLCLDNVIESIIEVICI